MFNFSSGIVPGKNSELRLETSQGDEVLGLGNINGLLVNARWQSNDSSTCVTERNYVYSILYRSVVTIAVLGHRNYPCRRRRHWSNNNPSLFYLRVSEMLSFFMWLSLESKRGKKWQQNFFTANYFYFRYLFNIFNPNPKTYGNGNPRFVGNRIQRSTFQQYLDPKTMTVRPHMKTRSICHVR